MKYCPHCGKPIKAAALKCIHCKQWVDGRDNQAVQPESTNSNTSSGISPVVAIIAALGVIVFGVIVYYLVKSDDGKSEPYATEQVEEKAEEFFDNSSSRDRDRSSSYDSDRSSSSSSSFGSASARTEICPLCHGESEATNEDCDFCGGWGKVKIREGACKRGCGCQVYISRLYGSTCINCLLTFDCYGTESDHEH